VVNRVRSSPGGRRTDLTLASTGGGGVPSSLIFTGLVVLWLLILVPAVARHQQEVARPTDASLSGRVLSRQRRRNQEVDSVDDEDAPVERVGTVRERAIVPAARTEVVGAGVAVKVPAARTGSRWDEDDAVDAPNPADDAPSAEDDDPAEPDAASGDGDHRRWERPPPRYRRGRGGFDPEAAARAARRRYAFRQRVVLTLLIAALLTGVVAAAAVPRVWWAHGAVDVVLVAYLVYLRRQVRMEEAIRARRAARMAGTRPTSAADDPELDEWARRGREVTRKPVERAATEDAPEAPTPAADAEPDPGGEDADDWTDDDDGERVHGVGEPVGLLPARRRGTDGEAAEPERALPLLQPAPPPPLPPGTTLVVVDDDELDLHDLDGPGQPPHRRAVGL
jgi:hypothetical protein